MAKTKQELKVENSTQFPNNNTGFITPSRLREFNVDMIDSTVNQLEFNTYETNVSASINSLDGRVTAVEGEVDTLQALTGSLATTGSNTFNGNQVVNGAVTASFFVGDGSGLTNLPGGGGATPTGSLLVTASAAGNTITFTKGDASTFDVTVGSAPINTGSFATTGSNTFVGNQVISGSLTTTGNANLGDAVSDIHTVVGIISASSGIIHFITPNNYIEDDGGTLGIVHESEISLNAPLVNATSLNTSNITTTGNTKLGNATSDSHTITGSLGISGSLAVNGSNTFNGNQLINGNVNITGSLTASGLIYPTVDGTFGVEVIQTDGGGNLELEVPRTIYEYVKNTSGGFLAKGTPVHSVGTVGFQTEVIAADAGDPTKMPATFILAQDLNDEGEGLGIAIGAIQGINTVGYTAGDPVWVAVGGGWTQSKPTGSALIQNLGIITKVDANGGGVVLGAGRSNDIPNLPPNTLWLGNTDWVATPYSASNFYTGSYTGSFTGDGSGLTNLPVPSINTGSLATTGSNTFVGNQTISGSVTVTGSISLTATDYYVSGSSSGSFISNITDTFTSVPRVNYVTTLSSASYATLAASSSFATDTLYLVDGALELPQVTTGSLVITGSLTITGSAYGNVTNVTVTSSTGSFNLSSGNFFTVTLPTGSTYFNITNIGAGQTVNILVNTNTANTASFSPNVRQATGSFYTPSASGSQDVLTLISWNTSSVYLAYVKGMV